MVPALVWQLSLADMVRVVDSSWVDGATVTILTPAESQRSHSDEVEVVKDAGHDEKRNHYQAQYESNDH